MDQAAPATDLEQIGAPIADALLRGWRVKWRTASPAELSKLRPPGPNLAVAISYPERKLAIVNIVSPWPESESLSETLWHELLHAKLSPLTDLVEKSGGAVMIEEQIVEDLGILLARMPLAAARKAVSALDASIALATRARVSAHALRARVGGPMDPKMIMEALDALIGGDAEKCQTILKGLIASAAGGGATPPTSDQEGTEAAQTAVSGDGAPGAAGAGESPAIAGRSAARRGADVDDVETVRARKVAQDLAADMQRMHADMKRMHTNELPDRKVQLIVRARARLGEDAISTATEKRILAAATFERAEEIIAIVEESPLATRARSGVELQSSRPNAQSPKGVSVDELAREGFDQTWIRDYQEMAKHDPLEAQAALEGGRAGLERRRARRAQNGAGS